LKRDSDRVFDLIGHCQLDQLVLALCVVYPVDAALPLRSPRPLALPASATASSTSTASGSTFRKLKLHQQRDLLNLSHCVPASHLELDRVIFVERH
jgi:hypothetical protein